MTLAITHTTPADGTFSVDGAAAWNKDHTLTGVSDVAQGGTGATSFTAGQLIYGAGTSPLATSANLVFNASGNLIINGAPTGAATTDKLQVNGDALIGSLRMNGAQITGLGSLAIRATGNGATVTGLAGDGIGAGSGGDFSLAAGFGGATSGTKGGNFTFTPGGFNGLAGSGGDGQFGGTDGAGVGNTGTSWLMIIGAASGGATAGTFTVADGTFTNLMTFDGGTGLLSAPNLKFGTYTAGVVVQAGYITVTDSGGTVRRLLVG